MRKLVIFVALMLIVSAGLVVYLRKHSQGDSVQTNVPAETKNESGDLKTRVVEFETIKASFAIFTNGIMRSFAASMYHNLSPNIFITAQNPNIITVTVPNATWNEFFLTLPIRLNPECLTTGDNERFCNGPNGKISFYINGVEDKSALIKPIKQGDTLLVTFGNETKEQIESQINQIPKLPQN